MKAAFLIFLFNLFFSTPLFANDLGKDVIGKLEKKFDGLITVEARFIQKAHISVAGIFKKEESKGHFYLKRPKRVKWAYTDPEIETLLLKDDLFYFYSKPDNQLLKKKVEELDDSSNYINLLLNKNDSLLNHYKIASLTESNGDYNVKLIPLNKGGNMQYLILSIRKTDYLLSGISFSDNLENSTTIIFEDIQLNKAISSNIFKIDVPKGTEIVNLNNEE
ncbi:MAG: outer membrane lipoprotein carrier protein LolA [Nitrospinae bacterium]|nr:outer membrane lipoprotein carrier protein LolA [Nitrospinota bacterium]